MLIYPDYPTSLSKVSLNEKYSKRATGYQVRKMFLNLTLFKIN